MSVGNYRRIDLVSVSRKVLGMNILFRLRDAVDNVLREELCSFGSDRVSTKFIFFDCEAPEPSNRH